MATKMIDNHYQPSGMSVMASIFFAAWSILMNFATIDNELIEPLLHIFQLGAAIAAIISFMCSISPEFKKSVLKFLKLH